MSYKKAVSAAGIGLAMIWLAAAPRAEAQASENDEGELSALSGVAFGGGPQGIGTKWSVTGGAGTPISRYGMVLFETMYMPLGQHTIQGWPARPTVNRSYLIDFGIDFHIRIPLRRHWEPYAIAGSGLLWNLVRQNTVDSMGAPLVRHFDQFNGALHTGGGVRYYISESWGIRPEVKVIVSKQVYTCVSMGVFYVVPTSWP